jgi:hypothetical protein
MGYSSILLFPVNGYTQIKNHYLVIVSFSFVGKQTCLIKYPAKDVNVVPTESGNSPNRLRRPPGVIVGAVSLTPLIQTKKARLYQDVLFLTALETTIF